MHAQWAESGCNKIIPIASSTKPVSAIFEIMVYLISIYFLIKWVITLRGLSTTNKTICYFEFTVQKICPRHVSTTNKTICYFEFTVQKICPRHVSTTNKTICYFEFTVQKICPRHEGFLQQIKQYATLKSQCKRYVPDTLSTTNKTICYFEFTVQKICPTFLGLGFCPFVSSITLTS